MDNVSRSSVLFLPRVISTFLSWRLRSWSLDARNSLSIWLNKDLWASPLEPLKRIDLVYSHFLADWIPHIWVKNVFRLLCCNTTSGALLTEITIIIVIFVLSPNPLIIKLRLKFFCILGTQCFQLCKATDMRVGASWLVLVSWVIEKVRLVNFLIWNVILRFFFAKANSPHM